MRRRGLKEKIIRSLSQSPAVTILGPRQVGKTTLTLEITKNLPSVYLDLENPEDFQKR